jgi:hypothetical protein
MTFNLWCLADIWKQYLSSPNLVNPSAPFKPSVLEATKYQTDSSDFPLYLKTVLIFYQISTPLSHSRIIQQH